jgi:hypothetical protein
MQGSPAFETAPMRHPLFPILRSVPLTAVLGAALLAGLALLRPAPAGAQTFFAESDALRRASGIQLTVSDLGENLSASSGTASASSELSSSLRRVDGRYRSGVLAVGAFGERRRFSQVTDTFSLSDDRDQSAGYGALVLGPLLTADDALFLVFSGGRRRDRFAYETYLRQLDATVSLQTGLMYRIGFLIAGYARGHEQLDLRLDDLSSDTETYRFAYSTWLAGIQLGDPERLGLLAVYQRKDSPAVAGTVIQLEPGSEQLVRLGLVVDGVRLEYSETQLRQSFVNNNLYRRRTDERVLLLGLPIGRRLFVGVSRRHTDSAEDFTLLGQPISSDGRRALDTVQVELQF